MLDHSIILKDPQTQQRPQELMLLRPLPVDCWDWTKAIALPRVPVTQRIDSSAAGAFRGLGAMP